MKNLRFVVDMDGCLSNFTLSFVQLIKQVTGKDVPYPSTSWFWYRDFITKEEDREVWKVIVESSDFWRNLPPLPDAQIGLRLLDSMSYNHDVYFMTARPGKAAKYQTERWLIEHGYSCPTVIRLDAMAAKGPLCDAMDVDVFIDDKPENCADVLACCPGTMVYIIDQPYNQDAPLGCRRVPNVYNVVLEVGLVGK